MAEQIVPGDARVELRKEFGGIHYGPQLALVFSTRI
jgi:hypothetical protein